LKVMWVDKANRVADFPGEESTDLGSDAPDCFEPASLPQAGLRLAGRSVVRGCYASASSAQRTQRPGRLGVLPTDRPVQVGPMSKRIVVIGQGKRNGQDAAGDLEAAGWQCVRVSTAEAGLSQLAVGDTAVVAVETGLSDAPAREVCAKIRAATPVPLVVMQTGKGSRDREEALACLRSGADVCLGPKEHSDLVVAQIRAQMRRATQYSRLFGSRGALELGDLKIDLDAREVHLHGEPVPMTRKEFELLSVLAMHEGQVIENGQLLESVWGYAEKCRTRTLEVHVCRLRSKLEADPSNPQVIVTVPCVGYRFTRPPLGRRSRGRA